MTTNYEKHFGDPLRVAETLSNAGICWGDADGGDAPCPRAVRAVPDARRGEVRPTALRSGWNGWKARL